MIIQTRLLIYITTREIGYTYKLDRTTVTVRAPSMLAISTIPASMGASSSTWAPSGCSALVGWEGSGLLSPADAFESLAPVTCCAASGTVTSVMGARLLLLSVAPHRVPGFFFPLVHGVGRRNILRQLKIQLSAYSTPWKVLDYTTRELTSWAADSVIFSILPACFRATLRGLLNGMGMLASRLAGLSMIRGILGSPGTLNLDCS
jgi:hypothetical protein